MIETCTSALTEYFPAGRFVWQINASIRFGFLNVWGLQDLYFDRGLDYGLFCVIHIYRKSPFPFHQSLFPRRLFR